MIRKWLREFTKPMEQRFILFFCFCFCFCFFVFVFLFLFLFLFFVSVLLFFYSFVFVLKKEGSFDPFLPFFPSPFHSFRLRLSSLTSENSHEKKTNLWGIFASESLAKQEFYTDSITPIL